MARQPMPKALSSLQSVQRSYTSELSVVSPVVVGEFGVWSSLWRRSCWSFVLASEWVGIQGKEGRELGVRQLPGLQRLRWLRSCCDIFSRELEDWGSLERLSCIVLECMIVINPIVNPIPIYGHQTRDNIFSMREPLLIISDLWCNISMTLSLIGGLVVAVPLTGHQDIQT
jgi:hypothetical protein